MNMLIGSLFGGSWIGGSSPMLADFCYYTMDLIFAAIIIISFFLYYLMYNYVKDKFSKKKLKVFSYILMTLAILNVIFIGILMEFIYIRHAYDILLPLSNRIIWLFLAIIAILMTVKAYDVLTFERNSKRKRKAKKKKK